MCINCWNEYGSPAIVSDKTVKAAELIAKVYDEHCTGGNLHVQLDDWNLEHFGSTFDEWLESVSGECDSPEDYQLQKECYDYLRELTVDERASALAMYDRYFETDKYKLPEYEPIPAPASIEINIVEGKAIATVSYTEGTALEAVINRFKEMGMVEYKEDE